MKNRWPLLTLSVLMAVLLGSCGTEPVEVEQPSYKDMKSMVVDILKTEDAQKALQESTIKAAGGKGGRMSMLTPQEHEEVRLTVKEVLVSPEYEKVIKKLMTDPRFAGEFGKAVNKQNKQIHKDLMKDPSYQKDLIAVMKNPDMEKMILEVLDSVQYRKQMLSMMQESLQSPIIRLELFELLKKAVSEELKPLPGEKVKKKKDEEGG